MRLSGGRNSDEGRVEIRIARSTRWFTICGLGWSIAEAGVVCRSLGLGYAQYALSSDFFAINGSKRSNLLESISCKGNEKSLEHCQLRTKIDGNGILCPENEIASVICTKGNLSAAEPIIQSISMSPFVRLFPMRSTNIPIHQSFSENGD